MKYQKKEKQQETISIKTIDVKGEDVYKPETRKKALLKKKYQPGRTFSLPKP
jgi:hypothetical protein